MCVNYALQIGILRWPLYTKHKVICSQDAAVTQPACLSRSSKLYQPGPEGASAVWVHSDGNALFSTDDVAIRCGNVPYAPWYAFHNLYPLAGSRALPHQARSLCHAPQF